MTLGEIPQEQTVFIVDCSLFALLSLTCKLTVLEISLPNYALNIKF